MNIQTEKIELAKLLLSTDNPKIIQAVKQVFKNGKKADFWDELSTEQQAEIEKGLLEIEEGKTSDYESFIANHR
jgi:predicted transcriptional regulator